LYPENETRIEEYKNVLREYEAGIRELEAKLPGQEEATLQEHKVRELEKKLQEQLNSLLK
jgi:hypothetical protein